MNFRIERDSIGEVEIPADALYGIHAARAKKNFPAEIPFPVDWYKSTGLVKVACYQTYRSFRDAVNARKGKELTLPVISDEIIDALIFGATCISEGKYFEQFVVPAVQGGAGTSINMNINEIIANLGLIQTGHSPGDYQFIDPTAHANIFQSTNDVVPTALTIAVLQLLNELEERINILRQAFEELEKRHRDDLRIGYTQMQEAIPSSFGLLFSTYCDALSRDWWRISKISERIKQVNIGGGAIGTGLAIPRYFIMEVLPVLRKFTGFPLAHGENLSDSTANLDRWVEMHAILKTTAVNLEKISSDLRLLSSDIAGNKTLTIPGVQVGSSIMPGKINPVIPEFVISSSHRIYSNDQLISSLAASGTLELNAYIPVIGAALIESIKLLTASCRTLHDNLVSGIAINKTNAYSSLIYSPAITTALVPHIGYHKAAEIASLMKAKSISITEANRELKLIPEDKLASIITPAKLIQLGFSVEEI